MNKKANIMDIVLTPTFVTIVALGIVLLTLINAIYGITSSLEFERRFYAVDTALLLESLMALPKEANVAIDYSWPINFGLNITAHKVRVYGGGEKEFEYTVDPLYAVLYKDFKPSKENSELTFYKTGNIIGIERKKDLPDISGYYCERQTMPKLNAVIDYHATIETTPTTIMTGDATISAQLNPTGDKLVKIYINPTPQSEQLACLMAQTFKRETGLQTAIIPVNTNFLAVGDPRLTLSTTQPALFVLAQGLPDNAATKATIYRSITQGVTLYGLE